MKQVKELFTRVTDTVTDNVLRAWDALLPRIDLLLHHLKKNRNKILLLAGVAAVIIAGSTLLVRSYLSNPDRLHGIYSEAEEHAVAIQNQLRPLQDYSPSTSDKKALGSLQSSLAEIEVSNPGRTGLSIYLEGNPDKSFEMSRLKNNDLEGLHQKTVHFTEDYTQALEALQPALSYTVEPLKNKPSAQETTRHFVELVSQLQTTQESYARTLQNNRLQEKEFQEINQVLQRMIDHARSMQQSANVKLWSRAVRDYKIEINTQLQRAWNDFYDSTMQQLSEHVSDYQRVQGLIRESP